MLRTKRRRGLTLIEIVVVITILSLLMTAVTVYAIGIGRESKVAVAKNELELIVRALDTYFALTGRYPTTTEGLSPLVERRILKALPVDPWGGEFGYELRDGTPVITCLGSDERTGGTGDAADLVSR